MDVMLINAWDISPATSGASKLAMMLPTLMISPRLRSRMPASTILVSCAVQGKGADQEEQRFASSRVEIVWHDH